MFAQLMTCVCKHSNRGQHQNYGVIASNTLGAECWKKGEILNKQSTLPIQRTERLRASIRGSISKGTKTTIVQKFNTNLVHSEMPWNLPPLPGNKLSPSMSCNCNLSHSLTDIEWKRNIQCTWCLVLLKSVAAQCLSTDRLTPPPLQPLQQCWQHSYIYIPNTTSGYDAEHVHSASLVDHGEACSEWNLSC